MKLSYVSNSLYDTQNLARIFSSRINKPILIALIGEIGLGKTEFCREFIFSKGESGEISSPSFSIVKEYALDTKINHIDFYRIKSIQELENIGFDEYFDDESINLVEWADMYFDYLLDLSKENIIIKIKIQEQKRIFEIYSHNNISIDKLKEISDDISNRCFD